MASSSPDQVKKDWEEMRAATGLGHSTAPSRSTSVLSAALWVVASFPMAAGALLASLAIRSRLADGDWPTLNNPDPKDFGFHYDLSLVGFLAAFLAVIVVPVIALIAFATGKKRITIRPVVLAFVSFALYFLFLRLDVGGIGSWFAD